jgi:Cyclic nucleotide-binding domain
LRDVTGSRIFAAGAKQRNHAMTFAGLVPYLANLAAALMLIGFTFRNQMWLRSFAILGNLTFIAYYFLVADVPLWTAILSASAIIAVNLWMIWKILKDNRVFQLNAEEMMLFARLPGLTPGQFRQLLAIAEWQNSGTPLALTEEGQKPSALHYVLEGRVSINKSGKSFQVGPHAFIGELAFLRGTAATATARAESGALVVSWPQFALRQLMSSNDGVRKAIDSLLTLDMAEKIARAVPPTLQEQQAH